MAICRYEGCQRPVESRGWCNPHYQKWYKHGTPDGKPKTKGWRHSKGYSVHMIDGMEVLDHVALASKALGAPLPRGAEVHHIDGNRANNDPNNLVVCPDRAYHMLLHRRQRALEECGHADWLKCGYCGQYDAPENIADYGKGQTPRHRECQSVYGRNRRKFKKPKEAA